MRFLVVVLVLLPALAHAHAILIESSPPPDGTAAAGLTRIVLRFNSRIDPARSRITLGTPLQLVPSSGPAELAADVVLTPGKQVLRWQVLAIDGHVTRGDLRFNVAP